MSYESASQILGGETPTWVNPKDGARIASYNLYDAMYKNAPATFQLMLRGAGDIPIYLPTTKKIIDSLSRYVGRDFGFNCVPVLDVGADQAAEETAQEGSVVLEAIKWYGDFFKRETLQSKFNAGKREFLRHGDWFWFIYADPNKPEGSRVSMRTLDPGMVFPLYDDVDYDKVVGYDLIEQIRREDEDVIKRQRYMSNKHPDHPSFGNPEASVQYFTDILEMDGWEDPEERKVLEVLVPQTELPNITALPIYHIANNAESNEFWGTSELAGLERAIVAINQATNDEDLALAMAGLGMYKSSSGGPVDANGNEIDWELGPGKVIEDETFDRVSGVSSLQPSLDHIAMLSKAIQEATGVTPTVLGDVDTTVAESGIALELRMSPTLDAARDKNSVIKDRWDQILYDLKSWFATYEGKSFEGVDVVTVFGAMLPKNRAKDIEELKQLLELGLISKRYFREKLADEHGYDFPEDIEDQIAEEKAADTAAADPYAGRMAEEMAGASSFEPTEE